MKNPLRESQGKGDKPRSCHNPKFRKNYDGIKWAFKNEKGKQLTLKRFKKLVKNFVKDLPRKKK